MHRARHPPGAGRGRYDPADHRPPAGVLPRHPLRGSEFMEKAEHRTKDGPLVDRLVGADVTQPRRSIRGQHDHRDAAVMCLQHGGVQVRDGGAGSGDHGGRSARTAGQPQRQEPGGAFVDPDVQPDPSGGIGLVQGHRQRRVAGTGRKHDLGDPAGDQLVDENTGQRCRRVHPCIVSGTRTGRGRRADARVGRLNWHRPM